jgi:hypothetical protein
MAVAASTFLKTTEPVVFFLLSLANNLSFSLVNTVTWSSKDLIRIGAEEHLYNISQAKSCIHCTMVDQAV